MSSQTIGSKVPWQTGSSGMCTEALISGLDTCEGENGAWKGQAIGLIGATIRPLIFLRDKGEIELSGAIVLEHLDLPKLERLVWDEEDTWKGGSKRESGYFSLTYGDAWELVTRPLRAFLATIPGYDRARLGHQQTKTLELYGYITMQLVSAIDG